MKDIYEALRESHERQRQLIRGLCKTEAKTAQRTELFVALRRELMAHAAAEERFLYAPIMQFDAGLSSSRHALSEHHEVDELLEKLTVADKSARGWMPRAKKLGEEVLHHLKEEETKFFQVSGKLLTAKQKIQLCRDYERDYERLLKVY
jgi:hemerythrin superfamily protein